MRHNLTFIGTRIRKLREKTEYNTGQLALLANCAIATMYDVENGFKFPSYKLLLKISKALGMTVSELTEGDKIENYQ